jgi:phosphinothricin acetyltransferase
MVESVSSGFQHVHGKARGATATDAAQICDIYNHYVRETVVTFEESPVIEGDMAQRIADVTSRLPWLVWEADSKLLGYAYATPWKPRAAYRHAVESSIYLAPDATGRGLGSKLYSELIAVLRRQGLHCVIGGAALPNPASVALHEKFGFAKVAEFRQVGFKFGRWIDVAYWELLL